MKNSFWGYWLILLGVFIVVIMLLVQNITTSSTQDYYLVKEITEAALIDAVDYAYYRNYSEIRINKEKFFESFLRRFAETSSLSTTYTINFYGIYEAPPKVSVEVKSVSSTFNVVGDAESFDMTERLDAILEGNNLALGPSGNVNLDNPSGGGTTSSNSSNGTTSENLSESGTKNPGISENQGDAPTSDFFKTINALRYSGSTSYYITTCTNGICRYTQENGIAKEGTISDTLLSLTPSSNTSVEVTPSCKDDYTKFDASGLKGYGMVELSLQKDATGFNTAKRIKLIKAGEEFTIVGLSSNKKWMLVESGSDCGYVLAEVVAVNLQEYLPKNGVNNVSFNITNQSGSIFFADNSKTRITDGKGNYMDGLKLYSSAYKPLAIHSFAQGVLKAAKNTNRTLVIYDAYRPLGATKKLYPIFSAYLKTSDAINSGYANRINNFCVGTSCGTTWFLMPNISTHTAACAIDVAFANSNDIPTSMHVMHPDSSNKSGKDAQELQSIMTSAGLTGIASEWWHFESRSCYETQYFRNSATYVKNGSNFWSNY